ncbi:MAG TPA: Do family serine endopeptidase [Rhodospirillales bacterium]|nr:Do family serine endopeptidase [Rhodospirillales bacterium]
MIRLIAFAVVFLVNFGPVQAAEQKAVPGTRQQLQLSYAPLVRSAAPAVVNIFTKKVVRSRQVLPLFDDPFFRRFFGDTPGLTVPRERLENSLGSGVIVHGSGVIVTNFHVIEGAREISVVLADRRKYVAKVVGSDKRTDLAVLRIDPGNETLPFLELANSDDLEVGDIVLAIGNPFGVGQTVTSGIVSGLSRAGINSSDFSLFIQTDAAINPGNSGGALVGMDGRLVGINTAIFSKSGGSLGIGFAIPSNMVRTVIAGTVRGGHLVRSWLGAWGQTVTPEIAESIGMALPRGVLIKTIYANSPAHSAGLKLGDIVLDVDGHEVNQPKSLNYRFATLKIGGTAVLKILRKGETVELTVALQAPPEDPPRNVTTISGQHPFSGSVVANMSPALADEMGLRSFQAGVFILRIKQQSTAVRIGFQPGDKIERINDQAISSVAQLLETLDNNVGRWQISVRRGGKIRRVTINK